MHTFAGYFRHRSERISPQSANRCVVKNSYTALHYDVQYTVLWGLLANSGALILPAVPVGTLSDVSTVTRTVHIAVSDVSTVTSTVHIAVSDVSTVTRTVHIAVSGVAEGGSDTVVELRVAGSARNSPAI